MWKKTTGRGHHSVGLSGGRAEGAGDQERVLCTCSRSLKHHLSAQHALVGAPSSAATPRLMRAGCRRDPCSPPTTFAFTCRCSQLHQPQIFYSHTFRCEALYLLCFCCARTELGRCSRASAGPTAIKQNQSLCKRDEWDAAVLICLRQSATVGSPHVFSSPSS